jgi:ribosomal protein S18 acetylase RimI-like enzyme
MVEVRPATSADAAALAALSGQLGYPLDEATARERFAVVAEDPRHAVFVAQDDSGAVVGWIHIMPKIMLLVSQVCEIGGLVVDEQHRSTGVGRALAAEAEAWARRSGYRELTVRSDTRRSASHGFYPAQGFVAVKEQKVYKKALT